MVSIHSDNFSGNSAVTQNVSNGLACKSSQPSNNIVFNNCTFSNVSFNST